VSHAGPEGHVTYRGTVHALATGLLVAAGVSAIGNWIAVARGSSVGIYVCKPLTLVLMIAAALALDPTSDATRTWFVVALVLSLLGDVFLMLPRDAFIPGLVSFLLAHIAFIVGLWVDGIGFLALALGLALAAIAVLVVGSRIIRAVRASEHPEMAAPVGAYMTVISLMVASAAGTQEVLAIGGASLFFCSDALIAWERFVKARGWHRLAIIVTYHLAQAGLTLSLLN
jgi:uncharacterized membrane protein YhhN